MANKKNPSLQIIDPKLLLDELVEQYYKARDPHFPHRKLFRGESRTVYAMAEDWLGHLIARSAPSGACIYLNQILTNELGIKHGRIKPDIAVWSRGAFRLFLDLKMDLGYRRDFLDQAKAKNSAIENLRNAIVTFSEKSRSGSGHRKTHYTARIAKGLRYLYVVVSDGNIDQNLYLSTARQVNRLPYVKMLTLVRGVHLNEYGDLDKQPKSLESAKADVLAKVSQRGFRTLDCYLRRSFQ